MEAKPAHVLYIEDNDDDAVVIQERLVGAGSEFDIERAEGLSSALARLKGNPLGFEGRGLSS